MSEWKLIRYDADDQRIWTRVNSTYMPANVLLVDPPVPNVYLADHSADTHNAGNPDQTDDGPLRIDPYRIAVMDPCHPYRFSVPVIAERRASPDSDSWTGCSLEVLAKLQELVPDLMIKVYSAAQWKLLIKVIEIDRTRTASLLKNAGDAR